MEKKQVGTNRKELKAPLLPGKKYTGKAYIIVQKPHQGFQDFAIMTTTLKDGVIVDVAYSDPYLPIELMARLELLNEKQLEELKRTYPPGFRCA